MPTTRLRNLLNRLKYARAPATAAIETPNKMPWMIHVFKLLLEEEEEEESIEEEEEDDDESEEEQIVMAEGENVTVAK